MKRVDLTALGPAPRILLCRTDALGDLILCTPAFRALKQTFPDSEITVVCRSYAAPALAGNPNVDRVVEIRDESDEELKRVSNTSETYDIGIALYPSVFAARLLRALHIKTRIGTAGRWTSWRFTQRVVHSRKRNEKSEAAYNLDLLTPLGVSATDLRTEAFVSQAEREAIRSQLDSLGVPEVYTVIHPGSGGSALDWPLERFVALGSAFAAQGEAVVFTGSSNEAAALRSLEQLDTDGIYSLAGETDLRSLAALVAGARAVVANSTGPLHLAAALGTATVGLFPPAISMSPVRWAPPVGNSTVIQPDRDPCNCRNGICRQPEGRNCMELIGVEQVVSALIESESDAPGARISA